MNEMPDYTRQFIYGARADVIEDTTYCVLCKSMQQFDVFVELNQMCNLMSIDSLRFVHCRRHVRTFFRYASVETWTI